MDHVARVQRAVDFIEAHLKEELQTEAIAKAAAFSMWHFQRIFSASVGDTLKDYVRKRRLTLALLELTTSDRGILDIALDYQFESQEAFTRAFKSAFGVNPGECRREAAAGRANLLPLLSGKPKITIEYLNHLTRGTTMQPKFVVTQDKKIIGMSAKFITILSEDRTNFVVIPKLWDAYMARSHEIASRLSPADVGVCQAVDGGATGECSYVAGTEVKDFAAVPAGMESVTVPGGKYAVFTHKGKLDALEHTMKYIYGSWLARSGEELREAPDLEVYDQRFKFGQDDSELDIYIPVK